MDADDGASIVPLRDLLVRYAGLVTPAMPDPIPARAARSRADRSPRPEPPRLGEATQGLNDSVNTSPTSSGQATAAERDSPRHPEALEQLGLAAYLSGRDDDCEQALAGAHAALVERGELLRAARPALWLMFVLMNRGERARAAGWLARAQRLIEGVGHDVVERGYTLLPAALEQVGAGKLAAAAETFAEAAAVGTRFGDRDLVCLAHQGLGRVLIGLGDPARGIALLDETMLEVTTRGLSPHVAGTVYCSVISACFEMLDIRRAQEWTEALDLWCASQRDLVPYRGECLVHRAELMALHGAWRDAIVEARRACECLARASNRGPRGQALYQIAECHRLRGEFAQAEQAYEAANEAGVAPFPGLALLRLAQGRGDAARAALSRALAGARERRARARLLAAAVEVLLTAGDRAGALQAADELGALAEVLGTPFVKALASHARGAVRLGQGNAEGAVAPLQDARATWEDIGVPYEGARARALLADAYRALGDVDGAQLELASARRTFEELGAVQDAARARAALPPAVSPGPLTPRELEVLRLVAAGQTNRAIARELGISEKTVARHVSNIFTRLDLSSRSAATAYAFRHKLV